MHDSALSNQLKSPIWSCIIPRKVITQQGWNYKCQHYTVNAAVAVHINDSSESKQLIRHKQNISQTISGSLKHIWAVDIFNFYCLTLLYNKKQ